MKTTEMREIKSENRFKNIFSKRHKACNYFLMIKIKKRFLEKKQKYKKKKKQMHISDRHI